MLSLLRFPGSRVKALSNSNQQREFIEEQAKERGLTNLNVITGDIAKVSLIHLLCPYIQKFPKNNSTELDRTQLLLLGKFEYG